MDWFLYDIGLRRERVKGLRFVETIYDPEYLSKITVMIKSNERITNEKFLTQ